MTDLTCAAHHAPLTAAEPSRLEQVGTRQVCAWCRRPDGGTL
jgi:hypothetical protein